MRMVKDILVLTLEENMNNERELHRVKKNSYLRLAVGHTLQGKSLRLFTNYPMTSKIFLRDTYSELEIINPTLSENKYDSFDNYAEIKTNLSGAFQFYFTSDGSALISNKIGEGYFIIDPRFTFTINDQKEVYYELDGIVLQTYLAKNLGPFPEWQKRIQPALEGNYNMIHFTPLQELGYSRSGYSLRDQLRVNPDFSTKLCSVNWEMIEKFVQNLYEKHNCLSMTDLVFNHSSNDSPWIHKHPECAYNVVNSPHLRPAYLIDRVVWNLTVDVAAKKYSNRGLDDTVNHSGHVDTIRSILYDKINELRIHEFFLAHIDNAVLEFRKFLSDRGNNVDSNSPKTDLHLDHGKFRRLSSKVNHHSLYNAFYRNLLDVDAACIKYRDLLCGLNDEKYREIQSHVDAAVTNVIANIQYRFIDDHGLKLNKVSVDTPLMWNYFYHPDASVVGLKECEDRMTDEPRIMAFNGWVMNDDPMSNFAEYPSNVYLRRELVVWGDSVKLRYGRGPQDAPYLWKHMLEYTELTARIFHAVRLDNCHSTPTHVAQAMLDRARAVRPDLYIVAELFTGSVEVDNIFVNRLGINSLIREAQKAGNCNEQGRYVLQFGGLPVGAFVQQIPRPLVASSAHALFYDMTHDNESPICKRSPFDILATGAVVGMACCAIGSTRGYDELVPHYIDVVNEERPYSSWSNQISIDTGIVRAKSIINKLHKRLAVDNFNQVFVDQLDDNVIAITRQNPTQCRSVILVAHTAFWYPGDKPTHRYVRHITLSGRVTRVLFEARLHRDPNMVNSFAKQSTFINGLPGITTTVVENIEPATSQMIILELNKDTGCDIVHFSDFPPSSIIAFEVDMLPHERVYMASVHLGLATQFNARVRSSSMGQCLINELMVEQQIAKSSHQDIDKNSTFSHMSDASATDIEQLPALRELLGQTKIADLNRLMYRCHEEEQADFPGAGSYDVPDFGKLVFCGLQGLVSELDNIRQFNNLGHPICSNLRAGNWLMDYVANRLIRYGGILGEIGSWFRTMFEPITKLPRYLVPSQFEIVITGAHKLALEECFYKLGDHIVYGSTLMKNLALNSIMLCGVVRNCKLPPLSIKLENEQCTLSAGFPHFAEGIWRNWGRDTFIALKGLTLLTNRFEDARAIILMYAATVRHGLIPNLLGDGLVARYNARDATWFWLNSIKEYELFQAKLGSAGVSILQLPVARMYRNDGDKGLQLKDQPLCDVIQEVLQRHADGISFTERNAGHQIDEHMREEGFRVVAGLRNSTKFPFGGNEWNCGTWMDKMGSSSKAGNKGRPATPRDGSAVELVGLCASVLEWLIEASRNHQYPHQGITIGGNYLSWNDWYSDIKVYFDDMFFIPIDATDSRTAYNRGIYRDTVNSSLGFTDIQFKPNFLVTMVVAPSLFVVEHAWHALGLVEVELLGPLGMRTLSPRDWGYRGYYDNSNDSHDSSVAHGFNYHQGPEWVWLTGFYLQAKLEFCQRIFTTDTVRYASVIPDTISHVQLVLARLDRYIRNCPWRSLPELTNKDGAYCAHSCEAQAWSIASTMEALHRLLSMKIAQ